MQDLIYIYYLILVVTFVIYLFYQRHNKKLFPLGILLAVSICTEGFVELMIQTGKPYYYFYHIFGPLELILLSLTFYNYQSIGTVKKIILFIVPLFVIGSIIVSLAVIKLTGYQGLNTTIRGVFLIILSIITLFTFQNEGPYYKVPIFWICIGVLLYYGGIFFINGAYSSLIKKYPDEQAYFKKLHSVINIVFNYLLYLLFCIGFVCQRTTRKYN